MVSGKVSRNFNRIPEARTFVPRMYPSTGAVCYNKASIAVLERIEWANRGYLGIREPIAGKAEIERCVHPCRYLDSGVSNQRDCIG